MTYTVGDYLAERFVQMGLKHHFMVPGDYNLVLLDKLVARPETEQVGCCNELNASYAAEGYARVHGSAALIVTYNVGAFSALNGVAGAYAERLPVIFVSGSYNTNDVPMGNHLLHHTLAVHDLSYQYEMIQRVTCDAVRILHAEDAPHLIDRAIRSALSQRLPAYIEIPCNVAGLPCPRPTPFDALMSTPRSDCAALEAAVEAAAKTIAGAQRPVLLAGPHLRPFGAIDAFQRLAEAIGCGVGVQPPAKGFFPEDHPQFMGLYWGSVSSPGCNEIMDWADLVIAAGPLYTDYTTTGWTAMPEDGRTINAYSGRVRMPDSDHTGVQLAEFLAALAERVSKKDASLVQFDRSRQTIPPPEAAPAEAALSRRELLRQVQGLLDGESTLLVETGDCWFSGLSRKLPAGARFEIEMQWGSIGWALPASFGYALALEPGRRIITMTGDGSFQLTAQEMANMIRCGTNNVIFLVNNHGYVIESEIHDGPYNYYKNWDYAAFMGALNAGDGEGIGLKVGTAGELSAAIETAKSHTGGPVLIECAIPHGDCSQAMLEWGSKVAAANGRPPVVS